MTRFESVKKQISEKSINAKNHSTGAAGNKSTELFLPLGLSNKRNENISQIALHDLQTQWKNSARSSVEKKSHLSKLSNSPATEMKRNSCLNDATSFVTKATTYAESVQGCNLDLKYFCYLTLTIRFKTFSSY